MAQHKRRSESRKTTAIVRVRVTPEEKAEIKARCKAEGIPISQAIKAAISERSTQPRPPQHMIDRAELSRLMAEISRVGIHANQMAHHLNQGHQLEPGQAERLLTEVSAIRDAVCKTLGHSEP